MQSYAFAPGAATLTRLDLPVATLAEATRALPAGVYTTLRTYHTLGVLRFAQHLARLRESATLLGEPLTLDAAAVRAALGAVLRAAGYPESRVRLVATPATLYLLVEPLAPPDPALYTEGIRVATLLLARERPRVKSTAFTSVAAEAYAHKPEGVHELLMVTPAGALLEGLTSNFFGVLAGTLYTAGEGVLEGITRTLVLEVAERLGLPVQLRPVQLAEAGQLAEAFITSSSREVVPVVALDARPVGAGRPGPLTARLAGAVRAQIERECEYL